MRWRFLRAIAIFPHVRHRTALVSRSIARPRLNQRWNPIWDEVDEMLQALIEMRIVRRKPGGFLWMHSRIRDALRERLLDLFSKRRNKVHRDDRQHLHLGLADWCMTFFSATRDPLAVFQAIYHRCRVAQLAFDQAQKHPSQGEKVNNAQDKVSQEALLVRMRSALCEATNHLETGRASILAWGSRLDAERCLKGFWNLLQSMATDPLVLPKKPSHAARMNARNRRFFFMAGAKVLLYQMWLYRDLGDSKNVLQTCQQLEKFLTRPFGIGLDQGGDQQQFERDWSREHYWGEKHLKLEQAIVCISLRNYDCAQGRFAKLCSAPWPNDVASRATGSQQNQFPLQKLLNASTDRKVEGIVSEWANQSVVSKNGKVGAALPSTEKRKEELRYEVRRLMIYVLRRQMETHLLQHEVAANLKLCGKKSAADRVNHVRCAERLYLAARRLPRFVTEDEVSAIRRERSRLHSVLAGILAVKGDTKGVQRHINEAWIAVAHLPESEEFIAQCVVDLRRAYCKLHELLSIPVLRNHAALMMKGDGQAVFETLKGPTRRKRTFERIVAILADVQLNLDQIESRMMRTRKSLWWWMTLRRYQMVWLQYREIVRYWKRTNPNLRDLHESEASLNYATDHDGETARALLLETLRRVSFDVFQLARIVHAAVNVARISLLPSESASRRPSLAVIPLFQATIREKWVASIAQARRRLEHIRDARVKMPSRQSRKDNEWDLSKNVNTYVELVLKQTQEFLTDSSKHAKNNFTVRAKRREKD